MTIFELKFQIRKGDVVNNDCVVSQIKDTLVKTNKGNRWFGSHPGKPKILTVARNGEIYYRRGEK